MSVHCVCVPGLKRVRDPLGLELQTVGSVPWLGTDLGLLQEQPVLLKAEYLSSPLFSLLMYMWKGLSVCGYVRMKAGAHRSQRHGLLLNLSSSSCEPPQISARNRIWVLCESSVFSEMLSHLASPQYLKLLFQTGFLCVALFFLDHTL